MYQKITNVASFLVDKFFDWGNNMINLLPNLIVAILIFILFILLARLARKGIARLLSRLTDNEAVVRLVAKIVYLVVFGIGILVSLEALHLDRAVTSVLAGVGVIGLGLGIAFQDLAANFISGVSMAVKNQVKINDIIQTGDFYGKVSYVGLRETILQTVQGQSVIIPNKEIYQNPMIHYTTHHMRRIDLAVGISYGEDLHMVEKITVSAIQKLDFLLKGKEVKFYYTEFGSSSINFQVQYWIYFHNHAEYLHAISEGIKAIKDAYNQAGITIPFPIRTLDFGIKGGTPLSEMLGSKEERRTD